jgi:starch phosphorylase
MLPPSLSALEILARNLWWSWDTDASALWATIDPWRWNEANHNPYALLKDVEAFRWEELARDATFVAQLQDVMRRFHAYLSAPTWCQEHAPAVAKGGVAYFSMEFGLHESLRIYSGGLGILAGDHVRSCSDLGVPLTGVGLLYREGYFRQVIDQGEQVHTYPRARYDRLPLQPCLDENGDPVWVPFPMGKMTCLARVWRVDVGRTKVLLLDTDHERNDHGVRRLTHHLYGGGEDLRIAQEVLLGIGGVRALRALGLNPAVYHLNEGHCAFVPFELWREARATGLTASAALQEVRSKCAFTTHTPVPAGHDRFSFYAVDTILGPWRQSQQLPDGAFMDLGRVRPGDVDEPLTMTVLALRMSAKSNGVSALHGEVSRDMWKDMWPGRKVADVPIGHVTNGVHPFFFAAPETRALFDRYVPGWRDAPWEEERWLGLDAASDAEIEAWRHALRARLVDAIAERTGKRFDPNLPILGFARRFAPYKRGAMLFSDPERLRAMVERHPFQVVYAGKSHPHDGPGKKLVSEVLKWASDRRFRDHVAFLEDHDMRTGRLLTSGSDVWLNNPRRPQEASGTSGQKAALNGGLNLSILDGWWPEGFDGTNGWAIGEAKAWADVDAQDQADARSLYEQLETGVLPLWADRKGWLKAVRRAVQTCAPKFNSHRMVRDYVLGTYEPLASE